MGTEGSLQCSLDQIMSQTASVEPSLPYIPEIHCIIVTPANDYLSGLVTSWFSENDSITLPFSLLFYMSLSWHPPRCNRPDMKLFNKYFFY
jgi:hypothetical protein